MACVVLYLLSVTNVGSLSLSIYSQKSLLTTWETSFYQCSVCVGVHYHRWWPCKNGRNTFSKEYTLNQQEDFPLNRNVHHGGMATTVSARDAEREAKKRDVWQWNAGKVMKEYQL